MKLPLDLTERSVEFMGAIPCPCDETDGPRVHFEWDENYDLPDRGEMTVVFHVKRREERIRDNGSKHYEVSVELKTIKKVKAISSAPASSFNEAEKALDQLRKDSGE
jgi:hypothetical protein